MIDVGPTDKTKKLLTAVFATGIVLACVMVVVAVLIAAVGIPKMVSGISQDDDGGYGAILVGVLVGIAVLFLLNAAVWLLIFAGITIYCCVLLYKSRTRLDTRVEKKSGRFKLCQYLDSTFAFGCALAGFTLISTPAFSDPSVSALWIVIIAVNIISSIVFAVLNRLCRKKVYAELLQGGYTETSMFDDFKDR